MVTLEGVRPDQFTGLEDKLATMYQATMVFMTPNTGRIGSHGVSAAFVFYPELGRLTVDLGAHPWYVTEEAIQLNLMKALYA